MTYLEAAQVVLKEAGQPLHYAEIAKRALEKGLIEPKGKTPEATMGAQLYMAVKRAAAGEDESVFTNTRRAHFALSVASFEGSLDADIRKHNTEVEHELLDFLQDMHPRQLEMLVSRLLLAIGFDDAAVTKYSGDGGIDVDATLTVGGVTKVRTAIQVKRWKTNVTGSTVRELRGGLMTDQRGLIITTSGFTKDAIAESDASSKTPISLINGQRLVQLLVKEKIGIRHQERLLLELNLADLVVEDDGPTPGDKSATLWPLPGGKDHYFETLLNFLDYIGTAKPTVDEVTAWVMKHYEKVTKHQVVRSYLRAVLYSMGLLEFDGERVVLTKEGERLRGERTRELLVGYLKANVLGVEELLVFLKTGPHDTTAIWQHLVKTMSLSWETNQQTVYRLQWLQACGVVENAEKGWRLKEGAA
jgi:HJR/Mrr/RecB family endonuclease